MEIPLAGANDVWKGYLPVTEQSDGKVGVFYFTGTDLTGYIGTLITEGKLFVVDTSKPPAPISIGISRESNSNIKLEWYYDGEPVDYFNIYRRDATGVDYIHLYTTSAQAEYLDIATKRNTSYFYRVSAVDKSGNNGPLSAEVSMPSEISRSEQEQLDQIIAEQLLQQKKIEE